MNTRSEKLSLLSEMISFALVDGELHDHEYDFLALVATQMQIEKPAFLDLFRKRDEIKPIKKEFQRVLHFYQLALLMNCDGVLRDCESNAIHEIGIKMGLDPMAMNRILNLIKTSPEHIISPEIVIGAFQEQLN